MNKEKLNQLLELLEVANAEEREKILQLVRAEYTVLPRFFYHQPFDYFLDTYPVRFDPPEQMEGLLPIPGQNDRMGYSPNDFQEYLLTGKYDHDIIISHVNKNLAAKPVNKSAPRHPFNLLDFGCSSGRVLRHFDVERKELGWNLHGVDIQAKPIQWIREHFPQEFCVSTCGLYPHLPFASNTFDVIYGISVFTHIKYLWDAWLLELRRILKPGGLLIQSIHCEAAWSFYYKNQHLDWVRQNHSPSMLEKAEMDVPYFYYGDANVSQVFWKEEVAKEYWGRYFEVIELNSPPEKYSFQNWIVCRKSE